MKKKDIIGRLEKIRAKYPDEVNTSYKKKDRVEVLQATLAEAEKDVIAYEAALNDEDHSEKDPARHQQKDDQENDPPKAEIPEETVAHFKDEENVEYCGTFGRINLDSPACKECEKIMAHRNTLCAAINVQDAEKVEAKKASRKNKGGNGNRKRSEYKNFLANMINEGGNTRQAIIDAFVAAYPEAAKSTATTYISDGPNAKYCAFPFLLNIDKKSKVVSYTKTPALGRAEYAKANG